MCHYCTEARLLYDLTRCINFGDLPGEKWSNKRKKKAFYLCPKKHSKKAKSTLLDDFESTLVPFFHFYAQECSLQTLLCFIDKLPEDELTYIESYSYEPKKTHELHPLYDPRSPHMLFDILASKILESIWEGKNWEDSLISLYKKRPHMKSRIFPSFSVVRKHIQTHPKNTQFVPTSGVLFDSTLLDAPLPNRTKKQSEAIINILQPFAFLYDYPDADYVKNYHVSEQHLMNALRLFLEACIEKPGDNNYIGSDEPGYGRSSAFDIIGSLPYFDMETFERLLRIAEYCVRFVPWNDTSREILLEIALGSSSTLYLREMGLWLSRRAAVRLFTHERYAALLQAPQEKSVSHLFQYLFLTCGVNERELADIRQYYDCPDFGL